MKKKVCLLWISFLLGMTTMMAQEIPAGLTNAFSKGNAQELSPYLSETVEVILQNEKQIYNQQEVKQTMSDFFSANKVNDFKVSHQGKRNESSFIIGMLYTSKGAYRINCFFKKNKQQYLINQIRIDKTNE
ncbi:MAG: DUF4783 domain-containing protein [Bacteroides sp.]